MKRLAIIGGSSPFTAELIDLLAGEGTAPMALVLQGRNAEELGLVSGFARHRLEPLGWEVRQQTDRRRALAGADIVLQQIRFGGPDARLEDERLALSHGIPADETLGPAALQSALRMAEDLRQLARKIVEECPAAIVLNLTNPLSLVTSALRLFGVERVVGLCELPLDTARAAAALAGAGATGFSWSYAGLNHRGFVFDLEQDGEPLMPRILAALRDGTFSGATAAEIADFGALPTKYFALLTGRAAPVGGRAAAVADIRHGIVADLRRDGGTLPAGLAERGGRWHRFAVAPAIRALCAAAADDLVLSVPDADLISREVMCGVSRDGVARRPASPPPPGITSLLTRFETHERSMIDALLDPSEANIRRALDDDPLVPADKVGPVAKLLSTRVICPAAA